MERGRYLEAIRQHENAAGREAVALIEVGWTEFARQKFPFRRDVEAATSERRRRQAAPTARPGDSGDDVTGLKSKIVREALLQRDVDAIVE